MKILPTSPVTVTTYWAFTAQLAANLAIAASCDNSTNSSQSVRTEAAELYLETLMARLRQWHGTSLADCAAAGSAMAAAVLCGGKLYPWSGRGEFWSEASGTAGGLMGVYNLEVDVEHNSSGSISLSTGLSESDVVIIA